MLLYGVDSNSNVIPLLLDASGNVIVSASQLTTTGGKIKVDSSGRVTVTADEPSVLNPIGILSQLENLNLSAGTNLLTLYTVASGQRVRLTQASARYSGTVAGVTMNMYAIRPGAALPLIITVPPTNGFYHTVTVDVLLEEGDIIRCDITGATLNDDFRGILGLQRIK